MIQELQAQLEQETQKRNQAYTERNLCVALVAQLARQLGHTVGIKQHEGEEWEDDWRTVLFIDLPTGQVSWHLHQSELGNFPGLPEYTGSWDGHTTLEKYERVRRFIASLAPAIGERPTIVKWTRLDGTTDAFVSGDEDKIEERLHGLFLCRMNGKLSDLTIEH